MKDFIEGVGAVASAVGGLVPSNPGPSSQSASEMATTSFTVGDKPFTKEEIYLAIEVGLYIAAIIAGVYGLPILAAGFAIDAVIIGYWDKIVKKLLLWLINKIMQLLSSLWRFSKRAVELTGEGWQMIFDSGAGIIGRASPEAPPWGMYAYQTMPQAHSRA